MKRARNKMKMRNIHTPTKKGWFLKNNNNNNIIIIHEANACPHVPDLPLRKRNNLK
jgi:hypothetical protein